VYVCVCTVQLDDSEALYFGVQFNSVSADQEPAESELCRPYLSAASAHVF